MTLPAFTTPARLAAHWGVPERTLQASVREIGACRIIGNTMILTNGNVETILEPMRPCPSKSTGAAKSDAIEAPLRGGDYEALPEQLTARSRKGSKPRSKVALGNVVSMNRGGPDVGAGFQRLP